MADHNDAVSAPDAHEHAHGTVAHDHDFAAANQKHFDAEAKAFDAKPNAIELAKRISKAMISTYPTLFDEDKTTVLDFACGSGLLSRELSPHIKSVVGVDISQGMVDQYNYRVNNQGIPPEEMRAIRADLTRDPTVLEDYTFDLVVCVASYHHIVDIEEITRILAGFLKSGGSLLVGDIIKNESRAGKEDLLEHFRHVVPHKSGFTQAQIQETFEKAGLSGFEFANVTTAKLHGEDVDFFLARGVAA